MRVPVASLVAGLTLVTSLAAGGEPPTLVSLGVDPAALPVKVDGVPDVEGGLFRDGRVLLSGQPSEAALARLHELGVTAVVSLRTPKENDDRERVPYDEPAAVRALGMEWINIPLGGDDHPYTPAAVDRFAEVLATHPGPVLLHCTIGWRASYLWVAYLIRDQDMDLQAALARGESVAISPPPLQGLLDRKVTLAWR